MIQIDQDTTEFIAKYLGANISAVKDEAELGEALQRRINTLRNVGDGRLMEASPFSLSVGGKDLRREIIQGVIDGEGEDPAAVADDIMVNLGYASGYTESGDEYAEGFRDYLLDVGLVKNPEA